QPGREADPARDVRQLDGGNDGAEDDLIDRARRDLRPLHQLRDHLLPELERGEVLEGSAGLDEGSAQTGDDRDAAARSRGHGNLLGVRGGNSGGATGQEAPAAAEAAAGDVTNSSCFRLAVRATSAGTPTSRSPSR